MGPPQVDMQVNMNMGGPGGFQVSAQGYAPPGQAYAPGTKRMGEE